MAVELCGTSSETRKLPISKETAYLDTYIRGVYAKRDLKPGDLLTQDDIYMAIPLQKGQISSRELMLGKYGHRIIAECKKDGKVKIEHIDTPYSEDSKLRALINERGI